MKEKFVLGLLIVLVMPLLASAQLFGTPGTVPDAVVDVTASNPTATVTASANVSATNALVEAVTVAKDRKKRIGYRDRIRLGFTHENVARVRLELINGGFIDKDTPASEYEPMVRGIILTEADPVVKSEVLGDENGNITAESLGEIDWDNLSRIIEMILEFLSKILPMFLSPAPVG